MSRSQRDPLRTESSEPDDRAADREARAEAALLAKVSGYRRTAAIGPPLLSRTEAMPLHPEIDAVITRDPSRQIPSGGFISLSLRAARLIEAQVPVEQQGYFRAIASQAERMLSKPRPLGSELALAARLIRGSGPLTVIRAVARECLFLLQRPRQIGSAAKQAIAQALIAVRAQDGEESAAKAVTLLVDEVRRLDAVSALQRIGIRTGRPVVRLVFRSECDLWLVELERGALGLVWRSKRVWCWAHGRRDEVLACVPDTLFEAAFEATASVERDPPVSDGHETWDNHPVLANARFRRRHARGTSPGVDIPERCPRPAWR